MKVREGRRLLNVVFLGNTTIPGYKLLGNTKYPDIAKGERTESAYLKQLKDEREKQSGR